MHVHTFFFLFKINSNEIFFVSSTIIFIIPLSFSSCLQKWKFSLLQAFTSDQAK